MTPLLDFPDSALLATLLQQCKGQVKFLPQILRRMFASTQEEQSFFSSCLLASRQWAVSCWRREWERELGQIYAMLVVDGDSCGKESILMRENRNKNRPYNRRPTLKCRKSAKLDPRDKPNCTIFDENCLNYLGFVYL